MFQPVSASANLPRQEEEILRFWKERGIYEKSLAQREGAERFVFYEGPPTANGMPHPGHCLTRAIKDVFPRYKTMRGFLCERKAGWDTHGLPVEVEVCKELGIHSKEEIENYGIEPFIHRCQESVWRYMKEWERLTERLGFWIHLDQAYVTYHQSYVESVWWSLKQLFDTKINGQSLLYQGHKIVWWWAQGGTALSSGEVGQGYREVADPSVYVLFPLLDDAGDKTDTSLLVWTTTPWTLPSNQFAAVRPELDYATVLDGETGKRIVIASALVETIAEKLKRELQVESMCKGQELVGRRYVPPFDYFRRNATGFGHLIYKGHLFAHSDTRAPYYEEALQQYTNDLNRWLDGGQVAGWNGNWRVVPADFVTTDSGTGIVHIAPAFGEDDFNLLKRERQIVHANAINGADVRYLPRLMNPVLPNGKFSSDVKDYEGRWIKDCDKDIMRRLQKEGLLVSPLDLQYVHDYPFCWRAEEDPLIQYPRESWFIRTTLFKDEMLANNEQINWLPEHIKHGRFGNFLETNVDWALSRERYWGTPLPIWLCQVTGQKEAVGSYKELLAKPGVTGMEYWEAAKKANPNLPDDLRVHKPYIDKIRYESPFSKGAQMERVREVIDCWYDSGAMPFAQWGYPHTGTEKFAEQFPADFISEAIDQTRGWFYSQLAISTLLFGQDPSQTAAWNEYDQQEDEPSTQYSVQSTQQASEARPESNVQNPNSVAAPYPHPFRNCIVLGLMLGEDGQKMSKSKRNYREPAEIFDKYGADALRWFFFANQPPWTTIRYAERAIKDTIPEFILRLWNCFSFFVNYANSNDRFEPEKLLSGDAGQLAAADLAQGKGFRPAKERGELDRWILSELNRTAAAVVERMDEYDNYEACKRLNAFVDGLSNWYVRRSRDRFWAAMDAEHSQDKLDAYWTLYESLLTTAKLIAPFTPFLAEAMWQKLTGVFGERTTVSVHLCDFPTGDSSCVDEILSERMRLLRDIASLGLSARMANKLKVRQPLAKVEVILSEATHQKWLEAHDELLRDELNVKKIEYTKEADKYITYQVQPNFKRLGPRIGKLLPAAKQALGQADGGKLLAELTASGKVTLELSGEKIELDGEDIQVRLQAKPGWAAAQGSNVVVVLATELTPELLAEGIARDFVRVVQDTRKEMKLDFTDRVFVSFSSPSTEIIDSLRNFTTSIANEVLASWLKIESGPTNDDVRAEIGDTEVRIQVKRTELSRYFAYGSNMVESWLRRPNRAPSSRSLGVAKLDGYRFSFNKKSSDQSGKANIVRTDNSADSVYGALYECSNDDLARLKGREKGYAEKRLWLMFNNELINAVTFAAENDEIDDSAVPYTWYFNLVLQGAEDHKLPFQYIESKIKPWQKRAIGDPDADREKRNRSYLRGR